MIDNFIAYWGAAYISGLTVVCRLGHSLTKVMSFYDVYVIVGSDVSKIYSSKLLHLRKELPLNLLTFLNKKMNKHVYYAPLN